MTSNLNTLYPPTRSAGFFNSKVTIARLYPELNILLQARTLPKRLSEKDYISNIIPFQWFRRPQAVALPQRLLNALREHVCNKMPLRLIQLPQMKLVERSEVVNHIADQMAGIDEALLAEMEAKVDDLGKEAFLPWDEAGVDVEDDARENVWGSICQYLFLKFARYAILSHTWLQLDREIVYQDACQDSWPAAIGPNRKTGYEKLKGFCDIAYTKQGISLAWIDTLCINKDSSAELDESIQSMYKWYQNSSICITYLRDTTSLDDVKSDNWFRRGWTLQELIAPKRMQFYKSDWTRLSSSRFNGNDKADPTFQQIIYEATGVPPAELISFDPLVGSDIATRMSWAASRMTTRGEDQAYSLMGIFGVNFPISYGEGPERAFFRLIQAIISSRHTSHIMQALNWAGKSISDTVHTSRLIPSRPECYSVGTGVMDLDKMDESPKTSTFFPTHSKPMVLTHLGLRVRLLLVSADLVSLDKLYPAQKYGPFDINISLKFPPSTFEGITVLLDRRYSEVPPRYVYPPRRTTPFGSSFFLGIYTFKEENREGYIQIPLTSFAFILNIPNPYKDFTINDLTADHLEPTTKVDTRGVVQVRRIRTQYKLSGNKFEPVDTLKKQDLAVMNIKLLNVYL